MTQFDVCWLTTRRGRKVRVVVLQSDFLNDLSTRVVAPVAKAVSPMAVSRLNPILKIGDERFVLLAQELLSVHAGNLSGGEDSVREHRDQIIAAIDLLLTGI